MSAPQPRKRPRRVLSDDEDEGSDHSGTSETPRLDSSQKESSQPARKRGRGVNEVHVASEEEQKNLRRLPPHPDHKPLSQKQKSTGLSGTEHQLETSKGEVQGERKAGAPRLTTRIFSPRKRGTGRKRNNVKDATKEDPVDAGSAEIDSKMPSSSITGSKRDPPQYTPSPPVAPNKARKLRSAGGKLDEANAAVPGSTNRVDLATSAGLSNKADADTTPASPHAQSTASQPPQLSASTAKPSVTITSPRPDSQGVTQRLASSKTHAVDSTSTPAAYAEPLGASTAPRPCPPTTKTDQATPRTDFRKNPEACFRAWRQGNRRLAEKDGAIRERDALVAAQSEQLRSKDEQLKAKDEELKARDEQLKPKDEQLIALANEVKKTDELIATKDKMLLQKNHIIQQLEKAPQALHDKLSRTEKQVEQQNDRVRGLASQQETEAKRALRAEQALDSSHRLVEAKDVRLKEQDTQLKQQADDMQKLQQEHDDLQDETNFLKAFYT